MSKEIDAYVNAQVANGVPRADILASFAKSDDQELKKYAGVPDKKETTVAPPPPAPVDNSYLGIAKDLVKGYEVPAAVAGTGAAAYLAYKAGQNNAVPPPPPPPSAYQLAMEEAALRKANADAGIAEAKLQKFSGVQPTAAQITQPVGQTNLSLEDVMNRKMTLPTAVEQAAPTLAEKLVGTTAATIDPVNPIPPKVDLPPPPPPPAPELPPVAKAQAMLGVDAPNVSPAFMDRPNPYMNAPVETTKVPEITGQAGAAQPPKVKNVLAFSDVSKPVIPPGGAERRTGLTKEIAIEEGKLNAAQRQLAAKLGAEKLPATEWYSFQDEVYGKNPPKSDPKGGGVPEWDNIVKTAKNNPTKYPEIVAAIDKIEKKYPKQSGQANIGMLLGLAGNLVGGIGIAKALKEGDTATAGLGIIDQILANASLLAGKKGALGAIGSTASRLSPFMLGMTPSTLASGTLDSPEFREMMTRAKPTGAVPPPR
jgi:hypothetical protein